MSKLVAILIASAFTFASAGSFAMSHGGGAEDEKKMEEAHEMMGEGMDACKDMEGEAKDECEKMHAEDEGMTGEMQEGEAMEGEAKQ